jgi:hypothetical protein
VQGVKGIKVGLFEESRWLKKHYAIIDLDIEYNGKVGGISYKVVRKRMHGGGSNLFKLSRKIKYTKRDFNLRKKVFVEKECETAYILGHFSFHGHDNMNVWLVPSNIWGSVLSSGLIEREGSIDDVGLLKEYLKMIQEEEKK